MGNSEVGKPLEAHLPLIPPMSQDAADSATDAKPKKTGEVGKPLEAHLPQIAPMSQDAADSATDAKPKKKICCACPDTKRLRDECIVEHGEAVCEKWIQAHLRCLRAEGFKI